MSLLGSIWVKLGLDNSNFKKGIKDSEQSANGFSSFLGKIGGLMAGAFSVAAVVNFAKKSVQAYNESVNALTKLNSVMRATGNASGITSEEMVSFASDLQKVTKFEDDATVNAMALLSAFKSVKGDIFKGAIIAAQDLATVLGTDINSAVMQIGKALEIPEVGLTMLRRSGVTFSEQQTAAIKKLLDEGNKYEAQLRILTALNEKFGGAARDAGNTAQGSWTKAWNALGDLMETLGSATDKTIGFAKSLQGWFEDLNTLFSSKNLTFWQKFTAAIGGNRKAFAAAMQEAKDYADSEKKITEEVNARMEAVKSVADAERVLASIKGKSLIGDRLKESLKAYIQNANAAKEEGDAVANGLIPRLEKEIEKKNELLKFAKDETSVRQLNDEIARLQRKLTLLKMTSQEAEKYNAPRTPLPAAPTAPSAITGAKVTTQNALDKDLKANQEYYNNLKAQREEALKDQEKDLETSQRLAEEFGSSVATSLSDSMSVLAEAIVGTSKLDTGALVEALLMPFADMAVKLGELAVATGVTALALKALEKFPATAIAAGVALIAVGQVARAGIRSISAGGSATVTPSTVYSGGSGGMSNDSGTSDVVSVIRGEDIYLVYQKTAQKRNR